MEKTYKANEVTYEDAPKKKHKKIIGVSDIQYRERFKRLLAESPDRVFLEPNWYVMDDSVFDGCLEKAPKDQVFIIEGYEEDWESAKRPTNALEVQMLADFGPPTIHWIAQVAWDNAVGQWTITKMSTVK